MWAFVKAWLLRVGVPGILFGFIAAAHLVAPPAGAQAPITGLSGFKNKLINPSFLVNTRGYVNAAVVGANGYFFDRWKTSSVGTGALAYGTAVGNVFGATTINSTQIYQVIEANNIEGGVYTLSWQAVPSTLPAATCRAYQGALDNGGAPSFVASPVTYIGLAPKTQVIVECLGLTGSLMAPQFEPGAAATPFEQRPYELEVMLAARYYQKGSAAWNGYSGAIGTTVATPITLAPAMRVTPTVTLTNSSATGVGTTGTPVIFATGTYVSDQHTTTATGGAAFLDTWTAEADF